MKNVQMFLDPFHVKKIIRSKLDAANASDTTLYERTLHAPSKAMVDAVIEFHSPAQTKYLEKFSK